MGFSLPIDGKRITLDSALPLLPLRDTVLFPGAVLPLFIGRAESVAAVQAADKAKRCLLAVAQKRPEVSSPRTNDLFEVGVIGRLRQIIRLPDGTMRIVVEGIARARLLQVLEGPSGLEAQYLPEEAAGKCPPGNPRARRALAAARAAFLEFSHQESRIPQEDLLRCLSEDDPCRASSLMASHLILPLSERQELLEASPATVRLDLLLRLLAAETEESRWVHRVSGAQPVAPPRPASVRGADVRRLARRAVEKEVTESEAELAELLRALEKARMPKAVEDKARRECERLSKMVYLSPEATVVRSYLDWLVGLPWHQRTRDRSSLRKAQAILDEEHYGLRPVKDRICEQIAVMKLSKQVRGPVLCLTGPPGVGKTSLGRSIARAMDRRFVRMSLGGIRDEAEIRGHRRTYIGALPGRIIQAMKRAGTINPVILLDEVDKLGMDYRGDPAAALLEVLDPEQNCAFSDHYLEVDYDLSHVLFLTTANNVAGIPPALRDRMEIIPLPGYLETEKLAIAARFLLPKQRAAAGLAEEDLDIASEALGRIVREYTREAGVRGLEREIARLCRRVALEKASSGEGRRRPKTRGAVSVKVSADRLETLLGVPRYVPSALIKADRIGIATALAWSETGGTILQIELSVLPGRGRLALTGRLGSTLRESARAALSCVRSRAEALGLERDFYRSVDIHLHIPEGEVPKDGPSAGAAIALAMISALTHRPTRESVAITGELTLTGRILPIGGLSEKLLAALRAGAKTVLIPAENRRQLADVPGEIRQGLHVVGVSRIEEVITRGLMPGRRTAEVSQRPGATIYRFPVVHPAGRRGQVHPEAHLPARENSASGSGPSRKRHC